tara:strand:+ start:227857 stop:228132 length:276 start_codon:yes stop_codon:yes gene_type:complete
LPENVSKEVIENSGALFVYPNPASSVLNIEAIDEGYCSECVLLDIQGREIRKISFTDAHHISFNVRGIQGGVCFVKMIGYNKVPVKKKHQF